jgi:hypothetical protein
VNDLLKRDLLHSMQMCMHDQFQKCKFHLMEMHEWLDKYNAISFSVHPYHDLTQRNDSYQEVSQRNWKEKKEISRFLLRVVTKSHRREILAQRPIFNHATE